MTTRISLSVLSALSALCILGFTSTSANAAGPDTARTAQCIAADGYWPGAHASRHFIPAEYIIAIRLPARTNVSTDEAGDNTIRPRGPLSCDAVVLVSPNDIGSDGMVRQGFFVGCGNWGTFAPVHVPTALVTSYPDQDRRLYDSTTDSRLDHLFIRRGMWLEATTQSSCLGGLFDPDGRYVPELKIYMPSWEPTPDPGGYIVDNVGDRMTVSYGVTSIGQKVRDIAASITILRVCETNPNLIWKGELDDNFHQECEEPQAGELVAAQFNMGWQSYDEYVMELVATGDVEQWPNGQVFLKNTCEEAPTLAELDQTANEVYADSYRGIGAGVDALFGGGSRIGTCDVCSTNAPLSTALLRPYVYMGGPAFGLEVAGRFGALGNHRDMDYSANAVYGADVSLLMNAQGPVAVRTGFLMEGGLDPYQDIHALRVGPELAIEIRALSWQNRQHLPHLILGGNAGWYQYADDTEQAAELGRNQDMNFLVFAGIGGQLPSLRMERKTAPATTDSDDE